MERAKLDPNDTWDYEKYATRQIPGPPIVIVQMHSKMTVQLKIDVRHPLCPMIHYDPHSLPTMSVIICFLAEPLSVLETTVKSVLYRTPSYLLDRIVLIDDHNANSSFIPG